MMGYYYLAIKKKERMPFAAPRNYHNGWSQTDKYYMILLIHGILKNGTDESMKQKYSHRCRKQINDYQRRKGDNMGDWDWQTHTTIFKIHNYLELTI